MLIYRAVLTGVVLSSLGYADAKNGKLLFDKASCLKCHSTTDFLNKKKKIKRFDQLRDRVQACQLVSNEGWFDDEVDDVAKYLNKEYYKLKE